MTLAQGPHGLLHCHAPGLAVVEVGQGPRVCPGLAAVQELPAHLLPELDVVAAAAPLPLGHVPLGAHSAGLTLTMLQHNKVIRCPDYTEFLLTSSEPWLQFLVRVWVTAAAVMAWM